MLSMLRLILISISLCKLYRVYVDHVKVRAIICLYIFMKNSLELLVLGDLRGSDILLEAVLEEEVARNARDFFSQAQNQVKSE